MRNPLNQVHAQILHPGSVDQDDHPISTTDAVHNALLTTLEPQRKPYLLKLVHTEFDTSDSCPVYDLHISVKPLRYVASENLACMGYQAPPESVEIAEKTTKLDVPCAFTDEMIKAHGDAIDGVMDYDIVIELPHSDYFLDVEIKTDFLTGNFLMYMFTLDTSTNKWEKIA